MGSFVGTLNAQRPSAFVFANVENFGKTDSSAKIAPIVLFKSAVDAVLDDIGEPFYATSTPSC